MALVLHAGLIALYRRGRWRGVLIEGPSGAGKSDLALRALGLGFRLVADDRVTLWTAQGRLFGAAPASLSGMIEARGLGVIDAPSRRFSEVRLLAQCIEGEPERVPPPESRVLLGIACPLVRLRPLDASAPIKLIAALSLLGDGP